MSTVLITGASGFIGRALAQSMAKDHKVVCMSRRDPDQSQTNYVRGNFATFEDLAQLNGFDIDAEVYMELEEFGKAESEYNKAKGFY